MRTRADGADALSRGALRRAHTMLTFEEAKVSPLVLSAASVVAFAVGVLARLGVHARSDAALLHGPDGHRVLTSADGYYFATGIKAALHGVLSDYDRVPTPWDSGLVAVGAAIGKLTGAHISDIAYHFPIYAAPLAVATVIAWGAVLRSARTTFLAMLPVSLGLGYLTRTGPGQFDTDLPALTVPYLALAAAMGSLTRQKRGLATLAGLCCACSYYLHPGSERVVSVCSFGVMAYVLLARRDRHGAYLLCALGAGLVPLPMLARIALLVLVHFGFPRVSLGPRAVLATAVSAFLAAHVALFLWHSDLAILGISPSRTIDALKFHSVRAEVEELQPISLATMAELVSGGSLVLGLASIGLVGLAVVHPVTLVMWPLFVLGTVVAHVRGERFAMYAMPVAALGLAWISARVLALAEQRVPWLRARWAYAVCTLGTALLVALPAASHARAATVVSTYGPESVGLMTELSKVARPDDYALAVWDESYGLWYYAGVRTLVDGSKQDSDLFVIAEAFYGDSQVAAAGLARLAVARQRSGSGTKSAIRAIFKDARARGQTPDEVLRAVTEGSFPLPPGRGEIYLCLSPRVAFLGLGGAQARKVVGIASRGDAAVGHIDLAAISGPLRGRFRTFGGGVIDADAWQLSYPGRVPARIASTVLFSTWSGGERTTREFSHHAEGGMHLLYFTKGDALMVVDDVMLRSNYVRLALFFAPESRAFIPVKYRTDSQIFRVNQSLAPRRAGELK